MTFAALLAAGPAGAQVSPNGPQFQVNSYTWGYQGYPAVAADGQGHLVLAWASEGSNGTDTNSLSVQAQLYDTSGTPLGGEFQVNTYTTGAQFYPSLAMDRQGNFVVAWDSFGSGGTDTDSHSIQAQRFDASGAPLGEQFQVNTYTTLYQWSPAVAVDGQGNFVVAWESRGSSGTDTDTFSIQAQRFDSSGAPLGNEFQVNTYTTSHQSVPAVAVGGQGDFVVTWSSFGSSGTDTNLWSVQAQRYDANGAPLGGEFQVNSYTTGTQWTSAVAADDQGGFVITWQSDGWIGTDTDGWSIQAQRFDADGAPLDGEFQINTYTTSSQMGPEIAADGRGRFVVAWISDGSSGTDTSYRSIQAQRFDASGAPLGEQFQVNTYTTGHQFDPAIAVDGKGNFVIAWTSQGSSGTDTSHYSVQAQRYDGLFRDGFESGDTARWSATGW